MATQTCFRIDTVILDCDDTLFNLRAVMMSALNKHTGKSIDWRAWSGYCAHEHYGIAKQTMLDILVSESALERETPEPGAYEFVKQIKQRGYAVEIWTARGYAPNAFETTRQQMFMLGIDPSCVRILDVDECKADRLMAHPKACLLIDDNPNYARKLIQHGYREHVRVPALPWNVDLDNLPGNSGAESIRYRHFNDVLDYLDALVHGNKLANESAVAATTTTP